jgi:hypothetical protein
MRAVSFKAVQFVLPCAREDDHRHFLYIMADVSQSLIHHKPRSISPASHYKISRKQTAIVRDNKTIYLPEANIFPTINSRSKRP